MPTTMDKLASSTMGALKDVKAGFKGLSGVFMHLMEEHGKVGALMKRVRASSDVDVRSELYPLIRRELLAHERGEVTVVYPELAAFPETSGIASEHASEASELQVAIAEVDQLPFTSAEWAPAFDNLLNLVFAHVDREESDYFPKAQKVLGDERAKELLARFEAAKSRTQ